MTAADGAPGSSGTRILVLATIAGFILTFVNPGAVVGSFALWPLGSGFMPWQVVTYALLHANGVHLAFNLLGLFTFGRELEMLMGRRAILQLYGASVLSAAAVQLLVARLSGLTYPTLGASGGVFGLLLAFALCFPKQTVLLLFPPIPLPAWLFAILYAAIELGLGVTGTLAQVAHFAHLGGMLGGFLFLRHWRRVAREMK